MIRFLWALATGCATAYGILHACAEHGVMLSLGVSYWIAAPIIFVSVLIGCRA